MTDQIPEVLHPVRGDSLSPVEHQLWRFRMVAVEVQSLIRGWYSFDDVAGIPDALFFPLTNQGLLLIAKFHEVWRSFGHLAKFDSNVVRVRKAVSPLSRRIDVWDGLTEFRNTALAHPYETKGKKLVGPWYLMTQHRVPTYHAEVILLLHCVNLIVAAVLATFATEYAALGPSLRTELPVPEAGPGIKSGDQIHPALNELTERVIAAMNAEGIPIDSAVYEEFRSATRRSKS